MIQWWSSDEGENIEEEERVELSIGNISPVTPVQDDIVKR